MTTTTDADTATSLKRLRALQRYLNAAYMTDLATLAPTRSTDTGPMLTVQRGTTPSDVVVAATYSTLYDRFIVTAYTSSGWYEYGTPFQAGDFTQVRHASSFILQFVPIHPAT